jgi:predicted N-acetyltransferase YhbS
MTVPEIIIGNERDADAPAINLLEERAFGPGRYARTAFRLREGNSHDLGLSFIARVGTLVVGSIRLSPLMIGNQPGLLLGPLTVDPAFRSKGIGRMLMEASIAAAKARSHRLILLVGDEAYYTRVGFRRVSPGRIILPGPVDPMRVLALELVEGAFGTLNGSVRAAEQT